MPRTNKKEAKEFLKNINSNDKVAIIHDNDEDGFMSAILLYNLCKRKSTIAKTFAFIRGKSSLEKYKLKRFNKILIADLAPNLINKELTKIKNKKIWYTDHHKKDVRIPKNILEYRTKSEISSAKAIFELTRGTPLQEAIANSVDMGIKQKNNKKIILKYLKKIKYSPQKWNKNILYPIARTIIYFEKNPRRAFNKLRRINTIKDIKILRKYDKKVGNEIKRQIKKYNNYHEKINKINLFHFNPKYPIKSAIVNEISTKKPKQTFIFITPKSKNTYSISARNQTGKVDMIKLLKKATKNLKDTTAGGHVPAAGGIIQKKDLQKFKDNLKRIS